MIVWLKACTKQALHDHNYTHTCIIVTCVMDKLSCMIHGRSRNYSGVCTLMDLGGIEYFLFHGNNHYDVLTCMHIHTSNSDKSFAYLYLDEEVPATTSSSEEISSSKFKTPDRASAEFGILLANIITELQKNESENLATITKICSFLTIEDDPYKFLFNEKQQEAIKACNNVDTLFTKHLRGCWRWDDFSFLKQIIQSLESSDRCKQMLKEYEQMLDSKMKLQQIYDHCKQEDQAIPAGYDTMVAIVHEKIFSRITKMEYDQLKEFITEHCRVKSYVVPPFHKAAKSSLVLEFIIPVTAVTHMVETATRNKAIFLQNGFVYMRIAMTVIFDKRDNVSFLQRLLLSEVLQLPDPSYLYL